MKEHILKKYWSQILAAVALIVWLIRLEGKLDFVEKTQNTEGARLIAAMDKMSTTQDKMADTINEMRTTLAGVVGYEKGASEARKVGKR